LAGPPRQRKPIACCADVEGKSISLTQGVAGRLCFTKRGVAHRDASGGGSECGNRNRISDANFLIVLHNSCGSILLSFRDMTTAGRTMNGGRMEQPTHSWPLRLVNNNHRALIECKPPPRLKKLSSKSI